MSRISHRRIGIVVWGVAGLATLFAFGFAPPKSIERVTHALSSAMGGSPQSFEAIVPIGLVQAGDPVFSQSVDTNGPANWKQVGHVLSTGPDRARIAWYDDSSPSSYSFCVHRQSGSLAEVIATMLPPEKQQQIRKRIEAAMTQHGQEIADSLAPLVRESLQRSLPVIESELQASMKRHQVEINELLQGWNDEIVQGRLVPLARQELLPIVRVHTQPEIESIGRQLWTKASMWRFGWRAIYDQTPLPQKDLLKEEWDRFVSEEAIPVFESHTDELVVALQDTLRDVAANPRVQEEFRSLARQVANDPQAQQLAREILRETLIESPTLRDVWKEVWTSEQAQASLRRMGNRLEPVVREIGDELFGSKEQGIDPNFARVLRSQILGKDRRWMEATPNASPASPPAQPIVTIASQPAVYPVVYLARPQENWSHESSSHAGPSEDRAPTTAGGLSKRSQGQ